MLRHIAEHCVWICEYAPMVAQRRWCGTEIVHVAFIDREVYVCSVCGGFAKAGRCPSSFAVLGVKKSVRFKCVVVNSNIGCACVWAQSRTDAMRSSVNRDWFACVGGAKVANVTYHALALEHLHKRVAGALGPAMGPRFDCVAREVGVRPCVPRCSSVAGKFCHHHNCRLNQASAERRFS